MATPESRMASSTEELRSIGSSQLRTPFSSMCSSAVVSFSEIGDVGLVAAVRDDETPTDSSMAKIVENRTAELYADACEAVSVERFGSAIAKLNRAISLKPQIAQYYADRAEIFIQLTDFRSAILNLRKAQMLDQKNQGHFLRLAFVNYFYGQILFDQKFYSEALDYFRLAARMKPDSIGYHVRCAITLSALGRHGECLDLVNKQLRLNRDNPDLYVMRAKLQTMFGNATLAYYDVQGALDLNGSHQEGIAMLRRIEDVAEGMKDTAVQQSLSGNMKDALTKLSSAIQTNPSVASYHTLRGTVHRRLGDFEAAVDDFLIALDKCGEIGGNTTTTTTTTREAHRQLVLTYNDFAVECFTKRYYNEAVVLLNKAIKAEKGEVGLYVNRGDCFYCMRELSFSLADYHQALELDGEVGPATAAVRSRVSVVHSEMGVKEFEEGRYGKADEHFTAAIENNGWIPRYYLCRAHCRHLLNDSAGTLNDVIAALVLDEENEEAGLFLQRLCPGEKVGTLLRRGRGAEIAVAFRQKMSLERPPSSGTVAGRRENDSVDAVVQHLAASFAFDSGRPDSEGRTSLKSLPSSDGNTICSAVELNDLAVVPLPRHLFPDLKACMKEREFHAKIYYSKKKMDSLVEKAMAKRSTLKCGGPRLLGREKTSRLLRGLTTSRTTTST